MGKNVAVFVDVANIFYAAKAAGVDIDYVTLLRSATAGRDLVRAYAYTGLDPDNENQRNFHNFLARHGYKVVSKDIRKYGDGKVKANLDIELVVDMMRTAQNLDIAIVVSGDGDFAPAIRAVQDTGVRVEVISFRGNTSSDLIDVADLFTDITQIAKVDKTSTKSGRRVAGDDEDLSMTEVPDKQTEGTGRGRTRGGRPVRVRTPEPAAAGARRDIGRGAERVATDRAAALTVMPGERLARAGTTAEDEEVGAAESPVAATGNGVDDQETEAGRRRRRRRGGRGRGRGRGTEAGAAPETEPAGRPLDEEELALVQEARQEEPPTRARRQPTPFGSVWDSQIGLPSAANSATIPSAGPEPVDEEDFEEPEIPEYLIAERNRQRGGQGRGPQRDRGRGGRGGAYAAALDRERYGGGRGATVSRFAEPSRPAPGRPPRDRGGRGFAPQRRDERPEPTRQPGGSTEPWSEVPPELEAMLRAQISGGRGQDQERRPATPSAPSRSEPDTQTETEVQTQSGAGTATRGRRPARTRTAGTAATADEAAVAEVTSVGAESEPAAEPTVSSRATGRGRTGRGRAASSAAEPSTAEATPASADAASGDAGAAAPAPRRRSTRTRAAGATAEESDATSEPTPRRRATRSRSATADTATETSAAAETPAEAGESEAPAPRRRTTRRTSATS